MTKGAHNFIDRGAPGLAETESLSEDVEQLARGFLAKLKGLALLARHVPLGPAVAVDLEELWPVAPLPAPGCCPLHSPLRLFEFCSINDFLS